MHTCIHAHMHTCIHACLDMVIHANTHVHQTRHRTTHARTRTHACGMHACVPPYLQQKTPCTRHQIISARGTRGTVPVSAPGSVSLSLSPLICAQERMEDPYMAQYYSGLFPRDNPRNTRCVSLSVCVHSCVCALLTVLLRGQQICHQFFHVHRSGRCYMRTCTRARVCMHTRTRDGVHAAYMHTSTPWHSTLLLLVQVSRSNCVSICATCPR